MRTLILFAFVLASPVFAQQRNHFLLPSAQLAESRFGSASAIEGDLAVVGRDGQGPGQAFGFDVQSGAQILDLVPSIGSGGDRFGGAIALDESMIAIGARLLDLATFNDGAVFVFDRATGQEVMILTGSSSVSNGRLGTSVALGGEFIAAGAPHSSSSNQARAYLFDRATGAELQAIEQPGSSAFGASIAVDAQFLLVGAPGDPINGLASGAAYIYDTSTGDLRWQLSPADGNANDEFGFRVALADGLAIVSAPGKEGISHASQGVVYVFDAQTGDELARIDPLDPDTDNRFGTSLSTDGATLAIGSPIDDLVKTNSGSVYVYELAGLQPIGEFAALDVDPFDRFGASVSIDFPNVVVGSAWDGPNCSQRGSAHLFTIDPDQAPGSNECSPAEANSSGLPGRLSFAWGGDLAKGNFLQLAATDLPAFGFGYFLVAGQPANIPMAGGSSGTLCLGGEIGRLSSQVHLISGSGTLSVGVDLAELPLSPVRPAQPGETWRFQAWFRDGQTSNFTNARAVVF